MQQLRLFFARFLPYVIFFIAKLFKVILHVCKMIFSALFFASKQQL